MPVGRRALGSEELAAFQGAVVEASMRLFVAHGYEGWSLRALAKELGCSHATPYRYFDGKEGIFAAVRIEGFRRFAAALRAGVEENADPQERLNGLAWAYFRFSKEQSSAFRVIFGMGQPEIDSYPGVRTAAKDAWSVVLQVVGEAIDAGVIYGDVEEVAHTAWASVHGVATLHLSHKLAMGRSAEAMLPAAIEALLRAYPGREPSGDPKDE